MSDKVIKFIKNNLSREVEDSIKCINGINGVQNVVCLPDISLKEKYKGLGYKIDFPSSTAIIADKNKIYPQLNARGINCGMTMIKIGRDQNDKEKLAKIEKIVLKINKGLLYNFFYKFHLPLVDKYNLNKKEMLEVSEQGIDYLIGKFNLDKEIKKMFEDGGRCAMQKSIKDNKYILERWLNGPKSLIKKFGRNFSGNHFLEVQVLDKIYNKDLADKFKIRENNIYIMYHTAGYGLESVANKDFCEKYIFKKEVVGVDDAEEKKLTMDLYSALMNFSYAYRLMTFIILRDELKKELGDIKVELITDVPHNTVRESEDGYIYRRNSINVYKDKLSILAGSYNSNSYLIIAGDNANISNYTADHGSEVLLNSLPRKSNLIIKRLLLKKGINNFLFRKKVEVNHDNAMDNPAVSLLAEKNIIKPVASFRPILNLKYN